MANVIQSCLDTKLGLFTFFFTSMDSSESFGLNCPSWLLTRAWLEGFVGMMVLTLRYFSAGILPALNVGKKLNSQFPRLLLLPASAEYRTMCESQRFTSLSTARLKNWEISSNLFLFLSDSGVFTENSTTFVANVNITIVARFCFRSRQIELKNHLYSRFRAQIDHNRQYLSYLHFKCM